MDTEIITSEFERAFNAEVTSISLCDDDLYVVFGTRRNTTSWDKTPHMFVNAKVIDGRAVFANTQYNVVLPDAHSVTDYGCFVRIVDGALHYSPMNADGSDSDEWGEITDPADEEFLNQVNELFGTSFQMSDF